MSASHRVIDEAFAAEAIAITDLDAEAMAIVRQFNRSEAPQTSDTVQRIMAIRDESERRTEALRRRYFPRSHRLVVGRLGGETSAITVSATGRSVRTVWRQPVTVHA